MTGRARRQSQLWSPRQHPPSSRRQFPHNLARSFAATLSNTESKTLVFRGLQNMPQDTLRGVTCDRRGSASRNPTRALRARPGEVRTFAVKALVTDEVLHPFGKVQPLLIGLILPDRVESSEATGRLFSLRASFTPIEALSLLARASRRWLVLTGVMPPCCRHAVGCVFAGR